jgi:polyketide synthase PksN
MEILRDMSKEYLKKLLAETLKISVNRIDSSKPLEHYGIDSILVVHLTNNLRKVFDNANNNLFFEYQTIDSLVDFFLKTRKDSLIKIVGYQKNVSGSNNRQHNASPVIHEVKQRDNKRFFNSYNEGIARKRPQEKVAEDIAIIGLSGRYPGAKNIKEFQANLKAGKNCITEIPKDRWDWKKYFDENKGKDGKIYTKWGGFIEDIDKFDPLFFRISPREAEEMDPQERLFLEVAYACIEDAGYTPGNLSDNNKVGVFVGVMNGNYATGYSYWSIANRISYLFNFKGPSIAINTACSSSLTAIHLAVESLHNGISECAIVGGVNLIVNPVHYIRLSSKIMLSKSDQCKAFGNNADGFVDGEGVGAVILKPLSRAKKDGDHIFGLIKGSMINAGGKTNGYTVPNPVAQGELIFDVLKITGINAREISCVEAHGTGTSLGDPVEIRGLTRAFRKFTEDKQFCSIGSVKSNIGHTESAAGIAAVTKVLLQLKNRQLFPSLHTNELNPNIDFENTPFVVQRELTEWKRPHITIDGKTKEFPRCAGISSFGAGGANAHILLAEYISDHKEENTNLNRERPAIIVVSARNEEKLKERAIDLLEELRSEAYGDSRLDMLEYTLQTGREAMEERLGFTANTINEVEEKLTAFVNGDGEKSGLRQGRVEENSLSVFSVDEDLKKAIDTWVSKGKYLKLLDMWIKGMDFSWDKLYDENKPVKMSLPTYPFAKQRYWAEDFPHNHVQERTLSSAIHPLVHENISDLTEQKFRSVFSGEEFFLSDHIIDGKKILPGAAHLEMAGIAVSLAAGIKKNEKKQIRLKNIAWVTPVVCKAEGIKLSIGLLPDDSGEIFFEIYSQDKEDELTLHSRGSAEVFEERAEVKIDLNAMIERNWSAELSAAECYELFKKLKIEYGPGHRGIEKIYINKQEVLAKIKMPISVLKDAEEYILHPAVVDSAIQATIGLMAREVKTKAPVYLDTVNILGSCTSSMWAAAKFSENKNKFDIDICDDSGEIRVQLKGLILKETGIENHNDVMLLAPQWEEEALSLKPSIKNYSKHIIFLVEPESINKEVIESQIKDARIIILESKKKDNKIEKRYQAYAKGMIEEIQKALADKPSEHILIQLLIMPTGEKKLFAGLLAILKTANLENPMINWQYLEVERSENLYGYIKKLAENAKSEPGISIRYSKKKRWIEKLHEIYISNIEPESPWADDGVYLITGGFGGLGQIFAQDIIKKARNTVLILTGRSSKSKDKESLLKELNNKTAQVDYYQVDIAKESEVGELIQTIRGKYGKLNGIIHSAGVIKDSFILKKDIKEINDVFSPKVKGLVNLDEATKDIQLDLFILFSSMAAITGNAGQADYAAANAFMDKYAKYRNEAVKSKQKYGKTVSINWTLWHEGGMKVDAGIEKMMQQQMGMSAIKTENGILALYRSMVLNEAQVLVIQGNPGRIQEKLFADITPLKTEKLENNIIEQSSSTSGIETDILRERAVIYFKNLLSATLKLPVTEIEYGSPFEKYGIDSIHAMQMTNELEKAFGPLSKTLFFEYKNIKDLTGYFLKNKLQKINEITGYGEKTADTDNAASISEMVAEQERASSKRVKRKRFLTGRPNFGKINETSEIAIIGVAGKYPGAATLEEFWENLKNGKD